MVGESRKARPQIPLVLEAVQISANLTPADVSGYSIGPAMVWLCCQYYGGSVVSINVLVPYILASASESFS